MHIQGMHGQTLDDRIRNAVCFQRGNTVMQSKIATSSKFSNPTSRKPALTVQGYNALSQKEIEIAQGRSISRKQETLIFRAWSGIVKQKQEENSRNFQETGGRRQTKVGLHLTGSNTTVCAPLTLISRLEGGQVLQ